MGVVIVRSAGAGVGACVGAKARRTAEAARIVLPARDLAVEGGWS